MKKKNYTLTIAWDRRYPKKGTCLCPIQLCINLNGQQFRMSLGLYATEHDYQKVLSGKGGTVEIKELRNEINNYRTKAKDILDIIPKLTREKFQRIFKSDVDLQKAKTDITILFNEYINALENEDRLKTRDNYKCALNSFKKFKPKLFFEDINETFLKNYRAWMLTEGNSHTTAQMYMRNLRAVFNLAIKDGYISQRLYPFNDFVIGTSAKSKSVLYPEEVKALFDYSPKSMREHRAKDIWMFCYLANGMNPKDFFYLKHKNIQGDFIVFVREKTKRTNTVADKEIRVFLHDELKRIIADMGTKAKTPDDFLFPFLKGYPTAAGMERRRKKFQKQANRKLREIGKQLGFTTPLILNLARHSFSTKLKLNAIPTTHITDALGHSNGKTTEHYLKSIPDKKIKQISDLLLNFEHDKED